MLKKIMLASIAVSALALNAPAAFADDPVAGCRFRSVQSDPVTGQNYEGVAEGYVVDASGGPVDVSCFISVNGANASETPTGTGTGAAVTAGRVTFQATDTDVVEICVRYHHRHPDGTWEEHIICVGTTHIVIPPQEVTDLEERYVDPEVCAILAQHAGTYGPIVIEDDGDIWINGSRWWDCPIYND